MSNVLYESHSEQETKTIAKHFAETLAGGDVVLLYGNLGVGKTTFVKGLAETFDIQEDITSPTFSLLNIYNLKSEIYNTIHHLVHIDTYRMKIEEELIEIGVEDYLNDPNIVCVIEWPEKITNLLKNKKTIEITIETTGKDERSIVIQNHKSEIRSTKSETKSKV